MSSTTKKIDVQFQIGLDGRHTIQIGLDGRHTMAYGGAAAKVAAELACKLQSQGRKPHLYVVWVEGSRVSTRSVAITTTRDTTARLSSLKKMIQNGEPIDG